MGINKEVSAIVFNDICHVINHKIDPCFAWLERTAEYFPFAIVSGLIFLLELLFYWLQGMQLPYHIALLFIVLSAIGCLFSACLLLARNRPLRTIQGISSFIGNASFMYFIH